MTIHDHLAELRALVVAIAETVDTLPVPDESPETVHLRILAVLGACTFAHEELDAITGGAALPPIGDAAPALEAWRRAVLEHPRDYRRRDLAAAWELTALEADRAGNTDMAARARREASFALGVRGAA